MEAEIFRAEEAVRREPAPARAQIAARKELTTDPNLRLLLNAEL